MKTIYLDSDFRCHLDDAADRTELQTEWFDNKCDAFIEGCRLVPEGEAWTRSDGEVFTGEMIAPAVPLSTLLQRQDQYEEDCFNMMPLEDVSDLIEIIYAMDLETIG